MTRDVLIDGRTQYVGRPDRAGVASGDDGGLYHRDTRHLSELSVSVEGAGAVTLGRDLPASNRRTVVATALDSTVNRVDDDTEKRTDLVRRETQAVVEGRGLAGRVSVVNHSRSAFEATLTVHFEADFADVFEVRGFSAAPDRQITATADDRSVRYAHEYEAADGEAIRRTTTVSFDREPADLEPGRATFDLAIGPQGSDEVEYAIEPGVDGPGTDRVRGEGHTADGQRVSQQSPEAQRADQPGVNGSRRDGGSKPAISVDTEHGAGPRPIELPEIRTGNPEYDRVFRRAGEDLAALTTETPHGPVPLAGAPWFATVFGRDSLIAAYQAIPVAPSLAAGTLSYLAAYQGSTDDHRRAEAPGKMFHEIRQGELARREAIPHTPYYGSVDATPLWVILLAEYHRWTGNTALVRDLSDALDAALSWVADARSAGADPFLAYEPSPSMGLVHHAWRDTPGAVQYPDGEPADPPIASVEVQGYVYRALRDAAMLFETVIGEADRAARLRTEATKLATAFESTFWLPEEQFYAAAMSAHGVVPTKTSNVGHCLWTGIVDEQRAPAVAQTLSSDALFSGWGLRTMSTEAAGYSPVSYHLGSVWPHDTSLTAIGLARYGFDTDAERLARRVLDASTTFEQSRIPELFCGFDDDTDPKPYPSSCVPQAWSAGSAYAFLRAAFDVQPAEDGVSIGVEPDRFPDTAIEPLRERWST